MRSEIENWLWDHTAWIAVPLLCIAVFVSFVANGILLPIVLLSLGAALFIVRYWTEIKTFDMWSFDEWANAKINTLSIRDWHSPYHAAEYFCDQRFVIARNEAAAEANNIMMDLIRDQERGLVVSDGADSLPRSDFQRSGLPRRAKGRHADHEAAQTRHDEYNLELARELLQQLVAGTLVAKGLPVRNDETLSERIIPTSRWRILSLNIAKAEASGRGLHYVGIVIGKKPAVALPVEKKRRRRARN